MKTIKVCMNGSILCIWGVEPVEGDVDLGDYIEVPVEGTRQMVSLTDGTVIRFEYIEQEGYWQASPVTLGKARVQHDDTTCDDTDIVTVTGDIAGVIAGGAYRKVKESAILSA